MVTKYNQTRDINGYNGFGLPPSDLNYSATLAATTDTTITVPDTMGMGANGIYSQSVWLAIITVSPSSGAVWVAVNAVAAIPVGTTFATSSSFLLVANGYNAIQVNGGDVLHFFSTPATNSVSVRFYSIS
jgi:hypothetical protein